MNTYTCESVSEITTVRAEERPREKLLADGAGSLSDHELLTVLIGSGTRSARIGALAKELLGCFDSAAGTPEAGDLLRIKGMGEAQTAKVLAAMEFVRRRLKPAEQKITNPADVLPVVRHFADRSRECFLSVPLNGAHEVISVRLVSIGLVNRTVVHPREVYADAVIQRATALIVAHNHPSGNLDPSREDLEITCRLRDAGEILGISLLDHVIFTSDRYVSLLENGVFDEE